MEGTLPALVLTHCTVAAIVTLHCHGSTASLVAETATARALALAICWPAFAALILTHCTVAAIVTLHCHGSTASLVPNTMKLERGCGFGHERV